jgi:Fur family ferric uptake transcriptional regulator
VVDDGRSRSDDVGAMSARLRSGGRRLGQARRRVLEVLQQQPGPVSAEELAAQLPEVHVSSVYRSLAVLEELDLVAHTHLAHGPALYELAPARDVVHLACEVCGRDVAVPSELFDPVRRRISRDYGFELSAHHFAIVGRCASCASTSPEHHRR